MRRQKIAQTSLFVLILFISVILLFVGSTYLPDLAVRIIFWAYYPVIFIATLLFTKFVDHKSLRDLGLSADKIMKKIALGLLIFAIYCFVTQIMPLLLGVKITDLTSFKPKSMLSVVVQTLYDLLFVGFVEELAFRGYLLEKIRSIGCSDLWAVVISSLLFGLWHYPSSQNWAQVGFTFALGLVFATIKLRSKNHSLIPLIIAHGLGDAALVWLAYFL